MVGSASPGRAYPGLPFDNGLVRLQISPSSVDPNNSDFTGLSFSVTSVPLQAGVEVSALRNAVGVLIENMLFHPGDNHLYAVDISAVGLVAVGTDPLAIISSFD